MCHPHGPVLSSHTRRVQTDPRAALTKTRCKTASMDWWCTFIGLEETPPHLTNNRFLGKDPQKQQLYLQGRAQLTKKQNQNPNPRRDSNQEWLPILSPEINPVYQAIAAKLLYHIWRELANNFISNNQQKDSEVSSWKSSPNLAPSLSISAFIKINK